MTDEEDIINGQPRLQSIYKNLMKFDYDNTRTRNENSLEDYQSSIGMNPKELVANFFKYRNDRDMNEEEKQYMDSIIDDIWEGK